MPPARRFSPSLPRREGTAAAPAEGSAIALDAHEENWSSAARKVLEHCCPSCPITG